MKETLIEHYCNCLSTKDSIFTTKEYYEDRCFVNELFKNGKSLRKYRVWDEGYQTRESAKEHFILSFFEDFLKINRDDKTRSS